MWRGSKLPRHRRLFSRGGAFTTPLASTLRQLGFAELAGDTFGPDLGAWLRRVVQQIRPRTADPIVPGFDFSAPGCGV